MWFPNVVPQMWFPMWFRNVFPNVVPHVVPQCVRNVVPNVFPNVVPNAVPHVGPNVVPNVVPCGSQVFPNVVAGFSPRACYSVFPYSSGRFLVVACGWARPAGRTSLKSRLNRPSAVHDVDSFDKPRYFTNASSDHDHGGAFE